MPFRPQFHNFCHNRFKIFMDFVHLHVHSHYSLLDGLMKAKALPKYAKERGCSAIALTDSGSMYGAIEFYQSCLANDVKPIIGFEAYIAPRRLTDKDPVLDANLYHLVLLAENVEGYHNLMQLSSIGYMDGFGMANRAWTKRS